MSEKDVTTAAERRLAGALDRLEAALTGPGSSVDLAAKLSEERTVTAQLTERIGALKHELAEKEAAATVAPIAAVAPVEDLSGVVAERDAELAELRAALAEAQGSVEAKLEALRAAHAAEIAALKQDMEGAAAGYAETLAAKEAALAAAKAAAAAAPAAAPAPVSAAPGDLAALAELSEVTAELRAKAEEGAADAALINRTLEAEVEALRIARHADLAEMRTLLAELEPMLEESAHA